MADMIEYFYSYGDLGMMLCKFLCYLFCLTVMSGLKPK